MLYDANKEMVRCFVIADDYRWHFLSDNAEEFLKMTLAYVDLMNRSAKENSYYFQNIFLERSEYERIKRNMNPETKEPSSDDIKYNEALQNQKNKRSHLQLVVSNP